MSSQSDSIDRLESFLGKITDRSSSIREIENNLDRINLEIGSVKDEIRIRLLSNKDEFDGQLKLGNQLYLNSIDNESKFKRLNLDLNHSEIGIIPNLLSKLESHRSISVKYQRSDQTLRANQSLSSAYQSISKLSSLIKSGQLGDASKSLNEFRSTVHDRLPHHSQSKLVRRAFRRIEELQEDLKQKLIDSIRESIVLREDRNQAPGTWLEISSEVQVKSNQPTVTSIGSSEALESLQNFCGTECQEEQIEKIVAKLLERITNPLIRSASVDSDHRLSLVEDQASKDPRRLLHLAPSHSQDHAGPYESIRLLLSTLGLMVFRRPLLQETFAKHFIPSLQNQVITDYLDPSLPSTTTQNEQSFILLPDLLSNTREFVDWLRENGWLDGLNKTDSSVLSDWCENVKDRFVCKVASRILEMARKAMLTTRWESMVVPWEIVEAVEPPPPRPPASSNHLNPALASEPVKKSTSDNEHRRFSSSLVRQFTEPLKQNIPTSDSIGFKSLFDFGSSGGGPSHDHAQTSQESTSASDLIGSSSPPGQEPKGFRSLFDFGIKTDISNSEENEASNNGNKNNGSATQTEKTSSPEMVEPPSDLSSPLSERLKSRSKGASFEEVNNESSSSSSQNNKNEGFAAVEEDVDWDLGCESSTENFLKDSNQNSSRRNAESGSLDDDPKDDVEEDAWGLDDVEDDNNNLLAGPASVWGKEKNDEKTSEEVSAEPNSSQKTTHRPISKEESDGKSLKGEKEEEEEYEPDPDSWGFEDDELGLDLDEEKDGEDAEGEGADEEGVMRLRGGVPSNEPSGGEEEEDEDEDAWGWNDDYPTQQQESSGAKDEMSKAGDDDGKQIESPREDSKLLEDRRPREIIRVEGLTISELVKKEIIGLVKESIDHSKVVLDPKFPSKCLRGSYSGLIKISIEVIDLYRIIMPMVHSELIENVPSLNAQFVNDSNWLSVEVLKFKDLKDLLIGGKDLGSGDGNDGDGDGFDRVLEVYGSEVEKVSNLLKGLASSIKKRQLDVQREGLIECLEEAEGFIDTSEEENYLKSEKVCKRLVYILQRLSGAWKPIMIRSDYFESMGSLIEGLLKKILMEIQSKKDISENESKALNKLLRENLKDDLNKFFIIENDGGLKDHNNNKVRGDDDFGGEEKKSEISRFVPSWFKFNFLSELLEASMADIMWMESEGLLNEFESFEIVGLVKALFADSDLRAKNVDVIINNRLRSHKVYHH